MSCAASATKASNEIMNVTIALLNRVSEVIPSTPYFVNNQNIEKEVHVHLVKSTDWVEFPFFGEQTKPKLPAIAFGVPMTRLSPSWYNNESGFEFAGEEPETAVIVKPSMFIDLVYEYKLVADSTIAVQNLMVQFIRAIRRKIAELSVYDRINEVYRVYDVDFEEYPDGSASVPAVDNLYQAKGSIKISGVEITSGEYDVYRTVSKLCVVGVRIEERVSADVNMSGDIILTIE